MTASNDSPGKPGFEYGFGTHFTPNVTWWNLGAQPWISYVSRCGYLLQQGLFVADVLYYNGDSAPNLVAVKHRPPDLGPGYDYDVCNAEVLLTPPVGRPGQNRPSRRHELPDPRVARQSAHACVDPGENPRLGESRGHRRGGAPATDSGLRNYPECDRQIAALVREVWGDCDGQTVKSHVYGRGRMIWNQPVRDILRDEGIPPDLVFQGKDDETFIDYIHRSAGETEIYFVANRKDRSESAVGRFRAGNKVPELWDPVTGLATAVSSSVAADGTTTVSLELSPYGSTFVIFRPGGSVRPPPQVARAAVHFRPLRELPERLAGSLLDPQWGGPDQAEFATLVDWTKRPEPGIKYYSRNGRLSIEASICRRSVPGRSGPGRLFLDLGEVKDVARLRLNGQGSGHAVDESLAAQKSPGSSRPPASRLEIEVVPEPPGPTA